MGGPTRRRQSGTPSSGIPSPDAPTPTARPSALGPSNQSALQRFQPIDYRLSFSQLQSVLRQGEQPLRTWLDDHIGYVRGLSARAAAAELLRRVPEARQQGFAYTEGVVRSWASENGVTLRAVSLVPHPADTGPAPAPSSSSISDSRIVSAVSSAISLVTDGVVIDRSHGRFQVNVSGATTELRTGRARFAGSLSWSGEMAFTSQVGDVHFNASVSAERWQVRLTFPDASMPVDISSLTAIFNEAGNALPRVVSQIAGAEGLSDIPDIAEQLAPEFAAVKRAMSTASQIGRTRPGVSFGVQVGGSGFSPEPPATGTPAAPQGVTVSGVLTIVF